MRRRRVLIAVSAVGLLGVVGWAVAEWYFAPTPITWGQYRQIRLGMSLETVCEILGSPPNYEYPPGTDTANLDYGRIGLCEGEPLAGGAGRGVSWWSTIYRNSAFSVRVGQAELPRVRLWLDANDVVVAKEFGTGYFQYRPPLCRVYQWFVPPPPPGPL